MFWFLTTAFLLSNPTPSAGWPSFRGDGSSTTTAANLPLNWSPSKNVAWRSALPGYGQSSPVIYQDRVYLTAVDGPDKEKLFVLALDTKTGKPVWQKEFAASAKGKNNPMMSRAAPTPTVDANGVYAFFESGDVIALSLTGEVRWQRSLAKYYGVFKNNHGLGSSPAQTATSLIILIDDLGPSYLIALDKATGQNLWKVERRSRGSWTSPVVAQVTGQPVVIVSSSGSLDAYDAATGKLLATHAGLVGNNIPSPTVVGDQVVIGAGENRMKPDLAASIKSNCCLRLEGRADQLAFQPVWSAKKAISHHASPLVYQGYVYFVTKIGVVHCLDLKTGEEQFAERLENQCWATPIGANGYVYFFGKDGVTTVLKAGPTFEKVTVNRLWDEAEFRQRREEAKARVAATLPKPPEGKGPGGGPPLPKEELEAARYSAVGDVVYGVAAGDGQLFLRTGTELFCVQAASGMK